ncbi:MAG: histidinol-phosphate transaminase [Lachnospiraceae bacterium]|nr:histidinol-phosphate transaminase [Lachnospiraceae bacterium]
MGNWRKNVRVVEPYVPGEQPKQEDMIKLNTNENPYPPAPGVEKVLKSMETGDFRLYPKPDARELVDALAEEYQVPANQVFVGVGSDDVLGMAFLTCFNGEKEILFPDITYSFYPVWADLFKIPYKRPALDENFCIKKEDYFVPNGGIVIANPNAPTSIAMPLADIEEIVAKNPDSVVIIDEAYVDFGGESALPLVDKYDNLLVVQTFSKSRSMAGMRIGFAIGNKELIDAMYAVRNSYNSYTMNMPSILCGVEAVKDHAYFDKTRQAIMETRTETAKKLEALGFTVLPSSANFLFAAHERVPAEELFQMLREKHIYVRYFKSPRIQNYLRITIGTPEQMEKFLAEVEKYLAE